MFLSNLNNVYIDYRDSNWIIILKKWAKKVKQVGSIDHPYNLNYKRLAVSGDPLHEIPWDNCLKIISENKKLRIKRLCLRNMNKTLKA